MADDDDPISSTKSVKKKDENGSRTPSDETEGRAEKVEPEVVPPEAAEALQKALKEGGPGGLLSIFAAASRTTIGPDPETAKVLAEAEKHSEENRLKGYQATLANRDKQNERDHEFRKKRLNHSTIVSSIVLITAVAGIAVGLYLYLTDKTQLAGYILLVSFMILLQVMGRNPFHWGSNG